MAHSVADRGTWGIRLAALVLLALPACAIEPGGPDDETGWEGDEIGWEGDEIGSESEELIAAPKTTLVNPIAPLASPTKYPAQPAPALTNEAHLCEISCSNGYTYAVKQCLPVGQSCVLNWPVLLPGQQCKTSDTIIGTC